MYIYTLALHVSIYGQHGNDGSESQRGVCSLQKPTFVGSTCFIGVIGRLHGPCSIFSNLKPFDAEILELQFNT